MITNPYTITWAIITPVTGLITKKDAAKMGVAVWGDCVGGRHFPDKDAAKDWARNQHPGKHYVCTFIKDAQFRRMRMVNGLAIFPPLTMRQINEQMLIY